jgi:hypothetical protein
MNAEKDRFNISFPESDDLRGLWVRLASTACGARKNDDANGQNKNQL